MSEGYVVSEPYQPSTFCGYVVTKTKREAEDEIVPENLIEKQVKISEDMKTLLSLLRDKSELTSIRVCDIGQAAISYLTEQDRCEPYDEDNCSEEQYNKDYEELFAPYFAAGEDFYHMLGSAINVVGIRYVPEIVCEVFEAVDCNDCEYVKKPFEDFAFAEVQPFFEEHLFPACKTEEEKSFLNKVLEQMTEDEKDHAESTRAFITETSCFEEASDTFDDCFPTYVDHMTKDELTLFFDKKIFPYCNGEEEKNKVQEWLNKFLEKK